MKLYNNQDKFINTLTKEQKLIFELIDKIENPETKLEYLIKLGKTDHNIEKKNDNNNYNFSDIMNMFKVEKRPITIQDLQSEINQTKQDIVQLKTDLKLSNEQIAQELISIRTEFANELLLTNTKIHKNIESEDHESELQNNTETTEISELNSTLNNIAKEDNNKLFLNLIDRIVFQKWFAAVTIVINKEFELTTVALIDSGADMNCIQEGIIPTKYYEKTTEKLHQASGSRLHIEYKLSNVHICNNGVCLKTTFVLVKDITSKIILGNPFIALLYPFTTTAKGISTEILGQKVLFEFIMPPIAKDVNLLKNLSISKSINIISKEKIQRKQKHIMYLKQEFKIQKARRTTKRSFITAKN
jgi:hypothetical protein